MVAQGLLPTKRNLPLTVPRGPVTLAGPNTNTHLPYYTVRNFIQP